MTNKETIRILQAFADDQKKTIDNLGETVEKISAISENMSTITSNMGLLLWKMEVLVNPVLLKDIYDLDHDDWLNLTTEQIIELIEALEDVPEQK